MKKIYIIPAQKEIQLTIETGILVESGNQQSFEVGISNDTMKGSEALSGKKDMWGNEGLWK